MWKFTRGPTFVIENSWLYRFKHKHLKLCMHLAKGLEISKAQDLISHFCDSFYQNLQACYN
jgi:hypothetical protein